MVNVPKYNRAFAPIMQGLYGPPRIRTRLHVADAGGEELGEITEVKSASFNASASRDTTWQLRLEMRPDPEFNVYEDWIKAVAEIFHKGEWIPYPLGLYRFLKPGGTHTQTGKEWSLTGYSGEVNIAEAPIPDVRKYAKGTMILQSVRDLLIEYGVPEYKIRLPYYLDKPLPRDRVFDPFNTQSKGKVIRVINDLLSVAAFAAIWCDRYGNFTTAKLADVRDQAPAVFYGPDVSAGEEPILIDSVSDDRDDSRFANWIIVTETNPDPGGPRITAVARNEDPNSQSSFERLGYWKLKRVRMDSISDPEDAQTMADAQLQVASGMNRKIGWSTPPDLPRTVKEFYSHRIPDESDPVEGKFKGDTISGDLHPRPQAFEFAGSKTEEV